MKKQNRIKEDKLPLASGRVVESSSTDTTTAQPSGKKAKKVKSGKPNIFKRMWRGLKEMGTELKKISWPKFGKVMAQLGVVLAAVLIFLVIIGLIDFGLSALLNLLVGGGANG